MQNKKQNKSYRKTKKQKVKMQNIEEGDKYSFDKKAIKVTFKII